ELRIPQRFLGNELAIEYLGVVLPEKIALHPLHTASEPLRDKLTLYTHGGVRISVVDSQGWLLAQTGTVSSSISEFDADAPEFVRGGVGRREKTPPSCGVPYGMWGPPVDAARAGESGATWFQAGAGEPSTVRAAAPILNKNAIVGVVAIEQAGGTLLR